MAFQTLISPNFQAQSAAGGCLIQAQKVVGAGGGPHSATSAANQTQYRHHDRDFPRDAIAVLWFSHWGTYWHYIQQRYTFEDYGHVVVWSPNAYGAGQGGYYSSPRSGIGGEWFRSITDIEAAFGATYRFWSEDLNGVRVCAPAVAANTPAAKPAPKDRRKPVAYITLDTNKKKRKQVLDKTARLLHKNDAGDTAITTGPGDYALSVEARLKGAPGATVTLTARRYTYDSEKKAYPENVYLNSVDVVIGATGMARVSFPVSNRVSGARQRIGIAAVVQGQGGPVTVERYAVKGHQWEI